MFKTDWFDRPALWIDRRLVEQEEYHRNRFPVDDEKLSKIRDSRQSLRKKDTRFAANIIAWMLFWVVIYNVAYVAFRLLWLVT